MRQTIDIARKLELTSIALGCLTRKELCAAFERVNPNTVMTLQNSYNWQSGRSSPRNFGLFEDWAAALGLAEGPHFIMTSSLEEFVRVLGERFSLPGQLLESFGQPPLATTVPAPDNEVGAAWRNGALLRGSFMALSRSWSPTQRGRLLCGSIAFDVQPGGGLTADYRENVLGRLIGFTGGGTEDGRTGQVTLKCDVNGASFFMAFHLPSVPGNLAGGVFAGNALYDPNSEPTASAILLLRNHRLPRAELDKAADYRDLDEASLAELLAMLGYGRDPAMAAERALCELLSTSGDAPPLVSVARHMLGPAAVLLDARRIAARNASPAGTFPYRRSAIVQE